jgi:hypothetical protein
MQVTSADINVFDFELDYDLTQVNPSVKITNKSTGANLAGCSYIFIAKTASGIAYHTGSWSAADKVGVWTTYTLPEPIIQVLGHIEWSGSLLSVVGWVKDSLGNVLGPLEKKAAICKPAGNDGKNNLAGATAEVLVRCADKKIYVQDLTNYSYQGSEGLELSKDLWLYYPADQTGQTPAPFHQQNLSSALIPIWFSSPYYQLIQETIRQYDLGDGVRVKIKYKIKYAFPVLCNVNLCSLASEVLKRVRALSSEGCSGEERDRLILLNALLNQAIIAQLQPLCGIDLVKLVDEIQAIGGFSCNCSYGDGIGAYTNPGEGYQVGDSCSQPSVNSINIQ